MRTTPLDDYDFLFGYSIDKLYQLKKANSDIHGKIFIFKIYLKCLCFNYFYDLKYI